MDKLYIDYRLSSLISLDILIMGVLGLLLSVSVVAVSVYNAAELTACLTVFIFLISVTRIIQLYSIASVEFFSFFSLGAFNVTKIMQFSLDNNALYNAEVFRNKCNYSDDTICTTALIISLFTVVFYASLIFFDKNYSLKVDQNTYLSSDLIEDSNDFDLFLQRIGLVVMIVFLPLYLFRLFQEVSMLGMYGGGFLYQTGGAASGNLLVKASRTLFMSGYFLCCASKPRFRVFVLSTSLVLLTNAVSLMQGMRGAFIATLFYCLWYAKAVYGKSVNFAKIAVIGVPVLYLLQFIADWRQGLTTGAGFWKAIYTVIVNQGISAYVLLSFVQLEKLLPVPDYPYILDPIVNSARNLIGYQGVTGQSVEVISNRFNLGHQIAYYIDSDYYLSGAALGNNCLAELWQFKWIGIIVGAVVLAVFINWFRNRNYNSRYVMFLSYLFIQHFALHFRAEYIISIYDIVKYSVFFIMAMLGYKVLNRFFWRDIQLCRMN